MIAVVLVGCVALIVAGVLVDRHWPSPTPVIESRMRERVIVTLKSGAAFAGVLWEADDRAWVLRNAVAVGAAGDESHLDVDGEVVVLAADIAFAQRP